MFSVFVSEIKKNNCELFLLPGQTHRPSGDKQQQMFRWNQQLRFTDQPSGGVPQGRDSVFSFFLSLQSQRSPASLFEILTCYKYLCNKSSLTTVTQSSNLSSSPPCPPAVDTTSNARLCKAQDGLVEHGADFRYKEQITAWCLVLPWCSFQSSTRWSWF